MSQHYFSPQPRPRTGSRRAARSGSLCRRPLRHDRPRAISPRTQLLDPACGNLRLPDKPLPEGGRWPELAEAHPVVSRDGKTYTFTVRKDARFSDGSRVTARAFGRAIERILDPAMKAHLAPDLRAALVGGEDVLAGKAKTPSGVVAKGRVLTMKLTKRIPASWS